MDLREDQSAAADVTSEPDLDNAAPDCISRHTSKDEPVGEMDHLNVHRGTSLCTCDSCCNDLAKCGNCSDQNSRERILQHVCPGELHHWFKRKSTICLQLGSIISSWFYSLLGLDL